MKKISDNIYIKNINNSKWFTTLGLYPRTIGHIKILVSIFDRIGIFNDFDLTTLSDMEADRLDIIYAILRITNRIFTIYLDHVIKKIYIPHMKEIFVCTDFPFYDAFIDQLSQDIDHFIGSIVYCSSEIEETDVKNKFVNYLNLIFKDKFYETIIKKLPYRIDEIFYKKNDSTFVYISKKFVKYTFSSLIIPHQEIKIFLQKTFDQQCSSETMKEIILIIKNSVNIKKLLSEPCLEIDIYNEHMLNDLSYQMLDSYNNDDGDNKNVKLERKKQEAQVTIA